MEGFVEHLPTGRKEKDEILEWADGTSKKQLKEYGEGKNKILGKCQEWENASTMAIDKALDTGRIETLIPKQIHDGMSPVEFEDWWQGFYHYYSSSFFSRRTNTPYCIEELLPLVPN